MSFLAWLAISNCKCLENMIKELTRPLLILVFTQCVMVKGSKGIQAWQYPLLITLQLHRAGTASYNLRKSYFNLFEKENIKNTKSKILCSISNSIKLSFPLRWFWNILHFSVLLKSFSFPWAITGAQVTLQITATIINFSYF